MKKRKVLFLINTLAGGGAEKVLINLLNTLNKEKYDIELVTISGGVHEKELPREVRYKKITNDNVQSWVRRLIYHMPPKLFAMLWLKNKYDVEIAYLEGYPTKVIATKKTKARKIAFVHMDASKDNTFDLIYKNEKNCKKNYLAFDKVCFVSEGAKQGFEKKIGKLVLGEVIYNIMDYNDIDKKKAEVKPIHFTTKGIKIIVVARLIPIKGIDRVLNIASKLQEKYDFEIIIVGDGEEREKLELIKKHNNIFNVRFAGYLSNPYPIMKEADLLICSSYYEGYSTVVCEALYLGVPVLTTDCAGMKDILEDGKYGMIVDNNELALEEGLEKILSTPSLFDFYKSMIKEGKNNGIEETLEKYEMILDDVRTI